ncbi:hypothetical protein RIR_jg5229.t2 [Rhizophagus irregularis DAOM 181602=DAOM 197198]|nr:hypothetical protein RIR_jg5229.t2 [Rhizophagus irregularis DAOM 181602=DAOM 197198]
MGKKSPYFRLYKLFILATFWFFGHRILTAWTYRISVRKWPWFFHIFRQVWTRRIGLCLQNPCEKTFNYRTSFILLYEISRLKDRFPIYEWDRMEMDFWFLGGLDEA